MFFDEGVVLLGELFDEVVGVGVVSSVVDLCVGGFGVVGDVFLD